MTMIRTRCEDCGEVELPADQVRARVCADDGSGSYVFRCPTCRMAVVKPAPRRVVEALIAAGVVLTTWHRPAELAEARPSLGPLTHDELLDFHERLHHAETWDAALDALFAGRSVMPVEPRQGSAP